MDLRAHLRMLPPEALLPAGWVLEQLEREPAPEAELARERSDGPDIEPTWREKLWTAPAETRIGTQEVAEAIGRPVSWVYRAKSLPRRKLDGELLFVVGEIRAWVRDHEDVIHAGRMDSTAAEKTHHLKAS